MASLRGCPLCNGSGTLGRTRVRYAAIMDAFTDRGIIGPDILRLARATEEEGRRLSPVRTGRMRNLHYRVVLPPRGYERDFYVGTKAGYAHYTVRQAAADWLAHGLEGRSPKTITKNHNVLAPILAVIGARKLRDLTAADVRQALAAMAAGYSTAAVSMGHLALKRAIRHAEASDLVTRNAAALADTPKGQHGRPSKSFTLDQAAAGHWPGWDHLGVLAAWAILLTAGAARWFRWE